MPGAGGASIGPVAIGRPSQHLKSWVGGMRAVRFYEAPAATAPGGSRSKVWASCTIGLHAAARSVLGARRRCARSPADSGSPGGTTGVGRKPGPRSFGGLRPSLGIHVPKDGEPDFDSPSTQFEEQKKVCTREERGSGAN